jgi:hypothetical protein
MAPSIGLEAYQVTVTGSSSAMAVMEPALSMVPIIVAANKVISILFFHCLPPFRGLSMQEKYHAG